MTAAAIISRRDFRELGAGKPIGPFETVVLQPEPDLIHQRIVPDQRQWCSRRTRHRTSIQYAVRESAVRYAGIFTPLNLAKMAI
jgi:hypothetical protein